MAGPITIKPINEPRAFKLSELFFSTTDPRGVIRYGNETFTRIAGYNLSDMVGQPHNLIRHPDMPRCAFRLVWDYLNRGQTVAAYVKNLASDGRYYWVLALIMPTDDGCLSIRLKPSSDLFVQVERIYAQALIAEQAAADAGANGRDVMDAGAASLLDNLSAAGFQDYDSFMSAALSAELTSRAEKLNHEADSPRAIPKIAANAREPERDRLVALFEGASKLDHQLGGVIAGPGTFAQLRDQVVPKSDYFLKMGRAIRLQSVNAEVQAARLGETGQALAMVAERLSRYAGEGAQTVGQLNTKLRDLIKPIATLVFDAMVSKVQVEMAAGFVREILDGQHDASEQARLNDNLQLLFQQFLARARGVPQALHRLQGELAGIDREIRDLGQFTRTMHFIYLTGKIETARHDSAQSFAAIFEEIRRMIEQADKVLAELGDSILANQKQIKLLGRIDAAAFDKLDQLLATTTAIKIDRPASRPTSGGTPRMTPHQIALVQNTWKLVLPIQDTAADLFYSKLFELDPALRSLFPENLAEQKKMLMQMITTAVRNLTKLGAIVPAVQALGARHAGYRVTPAMYDTVAAALLDTLEKGLGTAWTREAEEAWTLTYTTLATIMIQAQHDAKAAA